MGKPTEEEMIFGDANERFRGDVLDGAKAERLNRLHEICTAIAKRDKGLKYKEQAFSRESRNGTLILDFPSVWVGLDEETNRLLSRLFAEADDVGISTLGGRLRLSFGVQDIWAEFHYD